MTVAANSRRREYTWNGVTTEFDGPMAFEKEHISAHVTFDGVTRDISLSDLNVTRLGRPATRVEVLDTDIEVGSLLVILRTMPYTQGVQIANLGAFNAESLEQADDSSVMQIQQLADGVARSLRLADEVSAEGISFELPPPVAGGLFGWNLDASGLRNVDPTGPGDLTLRTDLGDEAGGAGLVAFKQTAVGAYARAVNSKLYETVSILDFIPPAEHAAILAGTSTFDATAYVQTAINDAVSTGRNLYAPGHYRLTSTVYIPGRLRLYGDGVEPNVGSIFLEARGKGSWFFIDHTGVGFDVNDGSTFRTGVTIEGIGTYRVQPDPAVIPFTPTAHDWDFLIDQADVTFNDVMLLNPTKGISIINGGYGRLSCNRLRGQPMTTGIDVNYAADSCRFNDVHFWPFWSNDTGARTWMQTSGACFRLGRCDNPILDGCFGIGYDKFIEVRNNGAGTTVKLRVSNSDADVGGSFLHVLAGANGCTAHFSNCVSQGATTYINGTNHNVQIAADSCRMQFSNCEFKDPFGSNMLVTGTGNTIIAGSLTVSLWNRANAGHLGIDIGAGNLFRADAQPFIITAGLGSTSFIGGAGTIDCPLGFYTTSVTTDASGRANLPHNSGTTPRKFIATVGGATGRFVTLVSVNAANATIEVRNAAGIVASTPSIPVYWQIGY